MTYVIATNNEGKLNEMRVILSKLGIEAVSLADVELDINVDETGVTFKENALLKAKAVCDATGMPAIADDSGLEIDALDGQPCVFTSSFGGDGLDERGRCKYLLQKMANVEQRCAKFVSTIACVFPDGKTIIAEGECRGEIAASPRGAGGFGYDPVFIAEGANRTMAELSDQEKNAVSHRGAALRNFYQILRESGSN